MIPVSAKDSCVSWAVWLELYLDHLLVSLGPAHLPLQKENKSVC